MPAIKRDHADQGLTLGYVDKRQEYIKILQQADGVLSTADHDFQGIAMLEAVACGCQPLAPNRLVYPDLYPLENLFAATPEDPEQQARAILDKLLKPADLQPVQANMTWSHCEAQYRQWIQQWL
ncbi:MAG: glycosyltransferase family 1 protein, partial [Proteobacteria bacterium]